MLIFQVSGQGVDFQIAYLNARNAVLFDFDQARKSIIAPSALHLNTSKCEKLFSAHDNLHGT